MLTVLQEPQTASPSFNDLTILVESTNYASADFKFVAVVKDTGTIIATLKAPLLYSNGAATDKGVFMIQRIIDPYTSYDFDLENDLTFLPDQNSMFNYEVELGEEYLGTEYLNLTSIDKWAFPGSMPVRDFAEFDFNDWTAASGNTGVMFLTNQRIRTIRPDQWDWLYFLDKSSPLAWYVDKVRYKSYNSTGLLKTVDVQYTSGGAGPIRMAKVPSGRNTSEISATILSGSLPIVHPAATYYTVSLYDNSDVLITEEYRINLLDDCSRYDPVHICYQNSMGGFDSFSFSCLSRTIYRPEKKTMRRQLHRLSGDTYLPDLNKHGLVAYDIRETKTMKLNSDWIDDTESEAIRELISSPYVFVVTPTDYVPVTVTNSEWETKTINNDGAFICTLDIQFDIERRQGA